MAPIDFFDRILNYYRKDANKDKPVIPRSAAATLSVAFTLLYVIPLYFSSETRPSLQLSRDAPAVVRARMRAVGLACLITTLITVYVAFEKAQTDLSQTLQLLGWWPIDPFDIAKSLALVTVLFVGPLYESGVIDGQWRSWLNGRGFAETFSYTIGWRNYVVAPLTEELVFRSLILPLHLLSLPPSSLHPKDPDPNSIHTSPLHTTIHPAVTQLMFVTPLYFGLAHLHHLYEFRISHPETHFLVGLARSIVQFGYTTLFGWFAAFLFLRTGNFWTCVVVHAFCNWQGLPRFWGRVGPTAEETVLMRHDVPSRAGAQEDETVRRKEDSDVGPGIHRRGTLSKERRVKQLSVIWTVAYYLLLVAGAVGFYWYFWPLTESKHALVSFGTPPIARGKAEVAKAVEAGARKIKGAQGAQDNQPRALWPWA